jgi:Polyketide cyclase / dehydrase and lipid transport
MDSAIDRRAVAVSLGADMPLDAARVWALIRDFDAMPRWNASVRQSRIKDGPADRVGCRRVLVFDDGGVWTHQLTGLSDEDRLVQYRIVATPQPMRIPVWNYRAAIRVLAACGAPQPEGIAGCRVQWDAWFETAQADAMQSRAQQVFEQGFAGLRRHFGV